MTAARVLVTFGSKRGGTAEIAAVIANALRARGLRVDCVRASAVGDVAGYDAVVVGGALYARRWVSEARRFVVRNASQLRMRPVWMFSSGPLDDSAKLAAPVPRVAVLMAHVGARGHATFGGRLASDATGFIASAMAKTRAGDWRSWEEVTSWADEIAQAIAISRPAAQPPPWRPARGLLAALCLATAITAIAGGGMLVASPDGALLHMQSSVLAHTPFSTFLVPGLVLLALVGMTNAIAGLLVLRDTPRANLAAFGAGAALLGWIVTEVLMLRTVHVLQLVYLVDAVIIMSEAMQRRATERMAAALRVARTWP